MKPLVRQLRRGFTLLELTIGIMVGMATASMVIALFNQQLAFLKIYQGQNFLTEEAPFISLYVSRIVGKADSFSLHANREDALAGINLRTISSPTVALNFRQPDGTLKRTILSFENRGSGNALNYYVVKDNSALGEPQWSVSRRPTQVEFLMQQGILRMLLTGPAGEKITYSGTMQQ